jgi:hypothetical protein
MVAERVQRVGWKAEHRVGVHTLSPESDTTLAALFEAVLSVNA